MARSSEARQARMQRARWLRKTVEPPPGTLGHVFPVPPDAFGFRPDGDDGAYLCDEDDFEYLDEKAR